MKRRVNAIPEGYNPQEIKRLVERGQLSKAMARLQPASFAPENENTVQLLRDLHPPCDPLIEPSIPVNAEAPKISMDHLIEALSSAPKSTAAGITGWSYVQLRWLLPKDGKAHHPLAWFAQELIQGKAPASAVKVLGTSRLLALSKNTGGVRPIAIGDTFRRWTTRAICLAYKKKWEKILGSHQFAVGTSGGGEKMIRLIDSFLQENDDHVIISLDAKNAFNSASRQKMMNELAVHFPELFKFFWGWYGKPSELWYVRSNAPLSVIHSQQGIQQGDAAGPFLFSLGLRPVLQKIQNELPDGMVAAYLDDISLGSTHHQVGKFVSKAIEYLGEYGLEQNLDKCKAWSNGWLDKKKNPPKIPDLPEKIVKCKEGLTLLGRPFGCSKFIESEMKKAMEDIEKGLNILSKFPDAQIAFLLLRCCASVKAHYLLRLLPISNPQFLEFVNRHDQAVLECAKHILRLPLDLSERSCIQLFLPIRDGGFGLRKLEQEGDAAFYGSAGATLADVIQRILIRKEGDKEKIFIEEVTISEEIEEIFIDSPPEEIEEIFLDSPDEIDINENRNQVVESVLNLPWVSEVGQAHERLMKKTQDSREREHDEFILPSVSDLALYSRTHLQKKASYIVHKQTRFSLLASLESESASEITAVKARADKNRSRLLSSAGPGATGWLLAMPFTPAISLSDADFRTSARFRLGLDIPSCQLSSRCICGQDLDADGSHAMVCNRGPQRSHRHDSLVRAFGNILREANATVEYEVSLASKGVVSTTLPDKDGRMDLVFRQDTGGSCFADVSVVHPSCKTYIEQSVKVEGFSAKQGAVRKNSKYAAIVEEKGHAFLPLIVESYGAWGEDTVSFLRTLANERATHLHGNKSNLVACMLNRWWQILSCTLQRGNVGMLDSRTAGRTESSSDQPSVVDLRDYR